MSEVKPETVVERVEVTVAELVLWIAAWEVVLLVMADCSKRTKLIVYISVLIIAMWVIIPVYKKRLAKGN